MLREVCEACAIREVRELENLKLRILRSDNIRVSRGMEELGADGGREAGGDTSGGGWW
jgi:hypothetical protein